jgi:hypothetical protein
MVYGVNYNLTLCVLQSSVDCSIFSILPWATLCQSRLFHLVRDFGFALRLSEFLGGQSLSAFISFGKSRLKPPTI